MTTITKPGIYFDFPTAAYFADPCPEPSLSQSIAKILLDKSPFHARFFHPRFEAAVEVEEDHDQTRHIIGNAAHKMILGRGVEILVAVDENGEEFSDWRKKAAQELRDDPANEGKIVILGKHMRLVENLVQAARSQFAAHQAKDVFTGGQSEVVIAWQEDGFWFRSMIDYLHSDRPVCDDLKTVSGSASPLAVPKIMDDGGWAIQAAFHERGLNVLDPDNAGRRRFRFVALEQKPPCRLTINELSEAEMTVGRRKVELAVSQWKQCMASKLWPAYPNVVQYPETPGYKMALWDIREREIMEGGG